MAFDNLLNPILNPLLTLGPFWAILIISVVVSLFTTLIYKFTTDQNKLRKLKADLKRYQKKASAAQKDNPEKAMKLQKDMMKLNGQYMKASFKSTLYTFIPVLIFFGWLGAHLAFAPIIPMSDFSISLDLQNGISGTFELVIPDNLSSSSDLIISTSNSSSITWSGISGPAGEYELKVFNNDTGDEFFFNVLISDYFYLPPKTIISQSKTFKSININYDKLLVFENIFLFKDLPWIKNWGWLGAYILFSIIFSTALRKIMKLA